MFFLDWWYSKKEYGSGENKAFKFTFGNDKKPQMKQKQGEKHDHTLLLSPCDLTSENKEFFFLPKRDFIS